MFYFTEHSKGVGRCQKAERVAPPWSSGERRVLASELVKSLAAKGDDRLSLGSNTRECGRRRQGDRYGDDRARGRPLGCPRPSPTSLSSVPSVDDLVIAAIERDANTLANYDIDGGGPSRDPETGRATPRRCTPCAIASRPRRRSCSSAGWRRSVPTPARPPFRRSTVASWASSTHLTTEMAPTRVNAIHPGIIGDSPYWKDKDTSLVLSRTPARSTVTMAEIVNAVEFLLDNTGDQRSESGGGRRLVAEVTVAATATD